jgi:hypothetical protein
LSTANKREKEKGVWDSVNCSDFVRKFPSGEEEKKIRQFKQFKD